MGLKAWIRSEETVVFVGSVLINGVLDIVAIYAMVPVIGILIGEILTK
jgi:hypothetical protein